MWMLSLTVAVAAEEPCTGHVFDERVDSEHFWVEWEGDTITEAQGTGIATYAERARGVFVDELGWPLTDEAIVYAVRDAEGSGIGGLAQTESCDGVSVPQIELYMGEYSETRALNIAAHELGHAAQYGYMGDYLDSVQSWLWWMEGTATWLASEVDGDPYSWAWDVEQYLSHPYIGLHQGLSAFLYPERSNHMYGTAVIASYLAEHHGGAGIIRDTWAFGGPLTGEEIDFRDALVAVGLDFEAVWAEWAARMPTVDLAWGYAVEHGVVALESVGSLPASGAPAYELEPQGLGFNAVHFEAGVGGRDQALSVVFEGDPEVPWTVVLVRVLDTAPGTPVLEYVPLAVDGQGRAEGWLSALHRGAAAFLVVSPHAIDLAPHAWSWSAESIDDPGPMDATVVLSEEPEGCGCAAGSRPVGTVPALLVLLLLRRRRPMG